MGVLSTLVVYKETASLVWAFYCTSGTHTGRLSQKQAILAYANLKMQSNDFLYLQGKQAASDVYGKV
jgi:hypothetical protein